VLEGLGCVTEAAIGLRDAAEEGLGVDETPGVADAAQNLDRFGPVAGGGPGVPEHQVPEGSEQHAGGGAPRQRARAIDGQAGGRALQDELWSALLDGQKGLVSVAVGHEHLLTQLSGQGVGLVDAGLSQGEVPS
jgi:hypothetical protein